MRPPQRLRVAYAAAGLFVSLAAPSWGQDVDTLFFEQVGDRPLDVEDLAFDQEETLWAGADELYRLVSGSSVWEEVYDGFLGDDILVLSLDTLFHSYSSGTSRSVDGGVTFFGVYDEGRTLFASDMAGPNNGVIVVGTFGGGTGIAYSTDRGATFTSATFTVSTGTEPFLESAVEIPDGPAAGRLVAGVFGGVVVSEDAGRTWSPSSLFQDARFWVQRVEVGTAPGTSNRRLYITLADAQLPNVQFYFSDDDGLTWTNVPNMEDAFLFVFVPQAEGYLLAVERATALEGDRLTLWQSLDAGQTWAEAGELPAETEGHTAHLISTNDMVIGPDNHVYVAVSRAGPEHEWVYRTTEPVFVANEPEAPPAPTGERLIVYPNPATGRLTVEATGGDEEVMLYDLLGRLVSRVRLVAGRAVLDTSRLPAGVYAVRAGSESRLVTIRR